MKKTYTAKFTVFYKIYIAFSVKPQNKDIVGHA